MTVQNAKLTAYRGPVFPILTLFRENGDVDIEGIEKYVAYLLDNGVKAVMCTVGTSRYDVMTLDEMLLVNEVVAKTVNQQAICIVTTPGFGPTSLAMKFAEHARNVGADAILALYPDRYYGDESIINYFRDLSENTDMKIMIHEMAMRAGRVMEAPSWQYTLPVMEKILGFENVIGMKEESADQELIKEINSNFADKCLIIGGRGGMGAHLKARAFGQKAYLAGIGNFNPAIEIDFFNALEANDIELAETFINNYEKPFFEVAIRIGWHPALKEAMFLSGCCSRYERKPMLSINESDRNKLKEAMTEIGLIQA